jgi:hypothetical protein
VKPALFTAAMAVIAWLAWEAGGRLAGWAGFEDVEILVQLGAVFATLTAAERLRRD